MLSKLFFLSAVSIFALQDLAVAQGIFRAASTDSTTSEFLLMQSCDKANPILGNMIEQKCEQNLIRFLWQGVDLTDQAQLIGADDPNDGFGGAVIFTPISKIRVYVNFNISGVIELMDIESAYQKFAQDRLPQLKNIELILVQSDWLARVYGEQFRHERALLNGAKSYLFINETQLSGDLFAKLMDEWYQVDPYEVKD